MARDHDWDYGYLIALEKKKLQRMHDCIQREGHLENNAIVTRDKAILSTVSLRQQKALHLYHLIREYKLLTWWD